MWEDNQITIVVLMTKSPLRKAAGTAADSLPCPPSLLTKERCALYLRNNPTSSNKATKPANPESPNLFIIAVRFPITFTPKIPLPKRTSDIAPTATNDVSK